VHREARSPERPARYCLGSYVFFAGVLLCSCSRHTGGPTPREPLPARPAHIAARLGTHIPSLTGQERLDFRARIDPDLKRIEVELCSSGFRIERLNAPSPGAERLLSNGVIITPQGQYACPGEGVDLPQSKPDECLHYAVNLPENSPDPTSFRRAGADALVSPDLWLWVPSPRPVGVDMQLHFTLPDGLVALLPWQAALPESAFAWKSAGAFSHAPAMPLLVPGGELRVASLAPGFGEQAGAVRDWLAQGARASSLLYGHFPVPRALVIAVPGERVGPGFGMALRGGGPSVVIFLDRQVNAAQLVNDWTATHEFLHLGVPRLPPEDAWLFEGLASYYTEVVRARARIISPAQAYQHLLDGFQRGRSNGSTLSLRDESSQMHERRSFYRVYWAGAALAFLTDVEARRASGPTLDDALRSFSECCAGSDDDWTAERVLAHLDQSLGAPRFTEHARSWLDRREFPEIDGTLRALGVARGARGEAVFGRAVNAAIRDAIMAPASLPTIRTRLPTEPQSQPHRGQ
jgi:hypothetical protein